MQRVGFSNQSSLRGEQFPELLAFIQQATGCLNVEIISIEECPEYTMIYYRIT